MIDLGFITIIECMYEDCIMPTREFTIRDAETKPQERGRAIMDHVVELWEGGSDRPENFQLIHFACNSRKAARLRMTRPGERDRVSQIMRERWQDPKQRDNIIAKVIAGNNAPGVRERRSASMKAHWADPKRKAEHSAKLTRGDAHRAARTPKTPVTCDICKKSLKGISALHLHQTRMHGD